MRALQNEKKKICLLKICRNGRRITALLAAAVALLITLPLAFAAQEQDPGEDIYREQLESSGAQELSQQLPEETRELLRQLGLADFSEDGVFRLDFEDVLQQTVLLTRQKAGGPLRAAFCVVGIIVLCALLQSVKT